MKDKIEKLVNDLNAASRAYYQEDKEIMSNYEYDQKYDELLKLELETGIILENSPTQKVGYEIVSKLKKDKHEEKALSLDKTKDRSFLSTWYPDKSKCLSWKLDGLTIIATYNKGKLVKAVTRGNGEVGEIVTHNAKFFHGLPNNIPVQSELVVRGEAIISYSEFNKINDRIPEVENRYKNPRNLASGTVRQLGSKIAAERNVCFKAFELVKFDKNDINKEFFDENSFYDRLSWLSKLGFDVVDHVLFLPEDDSEKVISMFEDLLNKNDFPSDGLVAMINNIEYAKKLGTTGKFPKYGMAFKWADELAETTIRKIEWNASRTGLINPVVVFDTVELEGTSVSRATAHNVSILKKLQLSVGSKITVYKANMIIPTINENIDPAGKVVIPETCPVCGSPTRVNVSEDGSETLYCDNPECAAKQIKSFVHFVKRDSMNIENLNESTLEKLIDAGYIKEFKDIYELDKYKEDLSKLDGLGEKSVKKMLENIEKSRNTTLGAFLSGLGIPLIGRTASKEIEKYFHGDIEKFLGASVSGFDFTKLNDFGEKMSDNLNEYLENNLDMVHELSKYMNFEIKEEKDNNIDLSGKIFVITGSVNHFKNRNELKEKIESLGGRVSGSVSSKTNYLINNDVSSTSGKNKKAKDLNIPIISEEDFIEMIN